MPRIIKRSILSILLFISTSIAQSGFFEPVPYKGAFGTSNWALGWTGLDHYGIFADTSSGGFAGTTEDANAIVVNISDGDILPGQTVNWTADTIYVLNGRVFVDSSATLNIQAGTVIKGAAGSGEAASALIVARGGKIYAEGSADRPIIFTTIEDDVNNPVDVAYDTKGKWGGIIMLGYAKINRPAGEHNIEGIPTTELRGLYGGNNNDDDSGILKYVSIRHGGAEIGEGNEINGLTLGGVGRGTTIDYVEVYANKDDGFEWFGGAVNGKHLVSAFCGDDAFDMDEGFRGKNQFIFAIQHAEFGNMCAEHDGAPKSAVAGEPKAYAITYNATFLGSGKNAKSTNEDQERIFRIRENWGGEYINCIFGDYDGYGLDIEDKYSPNDSKDRMAAGELKFLNNIWFNVNGYNLSDSIGRKDYVKAYLIDPANGNSQQDPGLFGVSRAQDGGLDPRPAVGGAAYQNLADYPTAISKDGFKRAIPRQIILNQNYPNPFNPVTSISFELPEAADIKLNIYNMLGEKAAELATGYHRAGVYKYSWNAGNLASGMYIYRLETNFSAVYRKMILIK